MATRARLTLVAGAILLLAANRSSTPGVTALDPLLQGADGVVVDHKLVPELLELRLQSQHHLLHRAGGEHLHLGGDGG
jgi:hypothetical protein